MLNRLVSELRKVEELLDQVDFMYKPGFFLNKERKAQLNKSRDYLLRQIRDLGCKYTAIKVTLKNRENGKVYTTTFTDISSADLVTVLHHRAPKFDIVKVKDIPIGKLILKKKRK